jgi:phytoene dehydrogenase-like protein
MGDKMAARYDAIIIGGGHNGLITAAYLGRAGLKVVVLERRPVLGGAAATEELFPGYHFNTGAQDAGLFHPAIVSDLDLLNHGLAFIESPVVAFAPQPDGEALTIFQSLERTVAEIARFSQQDAKHYPGYLAELQAYRRVLASVVNRTPPDLGSDLSVADLLPWFKPALTLRGLGKRQMMAFLRFLPLTAAEFLDEWFETPALKGLLGAAGIAGAMQGPMASGTAFLMLYHALGANGHGYRASHAVRGGIGALSVAAAEAAQRFTVDVRTDAAVERIIVKDDRVTGVLLKDGEQVSARVVASSADPRRTLFDLLGPDRLELRVVRRVKNIRFNGPAATVHLALQGLPVFQGQAAIESLQGHILISPSLEYLEHAYDDAKYGGFSSQPFLDAVIPSLLDPSLAPPGRHTMSITMQYAPFSLKEGQWEVEREQLGETIINTLAAYAPGLPDLVEERRIITPLDYAVDYSLAGGSGYHGEMALDQMFFMRPIAGYGAYESPVDGLYHCGAGSHPGGGVTGLPGYNAAREIIKDLTERTAARGEGLKQSGRL